MVQAGFDWMQWQIVVASALLPILVTDARSLERDELWALERPRASRMLSAASELKSLASRLAARVEVLVGEHVETVAGRVVVMVV